MGEPTLDFSHELGKFHCGVPWKFVFILNLAGRLIYKGMSNPLGDEDEWSFLGIVPEKNSA